MSDNNKPPRLNIKLQTPTLLQMENVECGPAALGIIMHYYGCWISLEQLRVECGVSRDGSNANSILKVAENYNFNANGYSIAPEEIFTEKDHFPFIVFWEFNHFLVVEGYKTGRVYLNDPATGPRSVSYDSFCKSYTGVALLIEPNENFVKVGKKPDITKGIFSRLRSGKKNLCLITLCSLLLILPGLVAPVCSRIFVDDIMVGNMTEWLYPLIAGIVATFFIKSLLSLIKQYYMLRLQTGLAIKECSRFMWHVMRLPVQFFLQRYGAEIGSRISLNEQIISTIAGEFTMVVTGLITAIFYLFVMFQYDGFLTCISILMAMVNLTAIRILWRWENDKNMQILKERGQLSSLSMGGMQMMETIKACGLDDDYFSKWAGYYSKLTTTNNMFAQKMALYKFIPGTFIMLNSAIVLVAGGLKVMSGDMSIGSLLAFQILSGAFLAAFGQFANLGTTLNVTKANIDRVEDVLAYEPTGIGETSIENKEIKRLSGEIVMKNVTFGYNRFAPPVIVDFSLDLKPGKRIALVGGSGSGKSTIARIIAGILDPWEGEILFDGKPREHYDQATFSNSLSVVDQTIFLFSGTIKNNLTLWDDSIADNQIIQAAKNACIHDDIVRRAGGYNFKVEENGRNFSGGQRQRLEIARALCKSPGIVILDEATSALDPLTEYEVDSNLRRCGCSCIIVAHRLSTIRDADEIIVLDKGKVVERGTHEELLLQNNGLYRKLISET